MFQPRLSPSLFQQQHQYGPPPAKKNSISHTRRGIATSPSSPAIAPPPRAVHYVSRGTQYSPPSQIMDDSQAEPVVDNIAQEPQPKNALHQNKVAATPLPEAPPSPKLRPTSILKQESPSLKRRQKQEETLSSTADDTDLLETKRVRSADVPVKVLPMRYELCEVEDIVILIANMISELIATNDDLPLRQGVLTRFHSRTPPGISVLDYLQRLAKHATLTPPLLLSMVYYIDRLCSLYPAFTITTLTVHRFLITAATVAAKGLSDSFWNNTTYARVGGIKLAELGLLELDFLYRVDWKIVPNPEVLVEYYRGLVERSDGYKLESDGESSSSEEEDLLDSLDLKQEATNVKWREWMENVSSANAAKQEVTEGTGEASIKEENVDS